MFRQAIEALKKVKGSRSQDVANYRILKAPSNDGFDYYAIDLSNIIGEGTSGMVFRANRIDPSTGEIDKSKGDFAVKAFLKDFDPDQDPGLQLEYKLLSQCIRTEKP